MIRIKYKRNYKLLIIGQICCYFGLAILSVRHLWVFPAHQYSVLVFLMLIGFIPSALLIYVAKRHEPYILVLNALFIVSAIFTVLREWALAGVFVLVPVFALLFQSQSMYWFATVCSFVLSLVLSWVFIFGAASTPENLVILMDVTTVFLILVFIIHFVVKDLKGQAVREAKHLQTILALSESVEAKDKYTRGHSERVAELSVWVSSKTTDLHLEDVLRCGLIHDVGKLAIPDAILLKETRLTAEEFELMKTHTIEGAKLCQSLEIPDVIVHGVLHHHERWDGMGYPHKLKGENIPLIGRVLCVADAIDAMCSDRSYRKALDMHKVQNQLREGAGKQFDPTLVDAVLADWTEVEKIYDTMHKQASNGIK